MNPTQQAVTDTLSLNGGNVFAHGSVAGRLLESGLNINALRTNDVLRKEEWLLYDRAVLDVARPALMAVSDIMGDGLAFPIPNAMGVTVVQHETASDMSAASTDISGITDAIKDTQNYALINIPLPITHKDFQLSVRVLEASRRNGTPLDTSRAQTASRRVSDALESMVFNGVNIVAGALTGTGNQIYGYLNHPNRNTGTVSANWSTVATGTQMLTDTLAMIAALQGDNMFGPYRMYVSIAAYVRLLDDLKAASDKAIINRLLEIPGLKGIRGTSQLTGTTVNLVNMQSETVQMLDGLQPMTVMWETHGGMMINFKVLAIMAPRVRADANGNCGVAHWS
jgi:uncharacterized linocin/CFP29 family protein